MGKIYRVQIVYSEKEVEAFSKFLLGLAWFCGERAISISYQGGDNLERLEHTFNPKTAVAHEKETPQ